MSNPCINRWGLTSFWQHFWYSDSRYALQLKQDKIFIELLKIYLAYGSEAPHTLFWNNYWYKTNPSPIDRKLSIRYRWSTVYDESSESYITYRLRLEGEEFFQTRITILRLESWLLINLYWFQPDKRRKKRLSRTKPVVYTEAATFTKTKPSSLTKVKSLVTQKQLQFATDSSLYTF